MKVIKIEQECMDCGAVNEDCTVFVYEDESIYFSTICIGCGKLGYNKMTIEEIMERLKKSRRRAMGCICGELGAQTRLATVKFV